MADKNVSQSRVDTPKDDNTKNVTVTVKTDSQSPPVEQSKIVEQVNPDGIVKKTSSDAVILDPEEEIELDLGFSQIKARRKHIEKFQKYDRRDRNVQEAEFYTYHDQRFERDGRF